MTRGSSRDSWEELVQVIEQFTAGRISYAALIDACGKARQWRKALELFGEMEQSQWLPKLAM